MYKRQSLAPELYTYSIILEEEGSRYSAEGELNIPIGEVEISMGEIKSDLKYLFSGGTTLNDEGKNGQVVLRPLNDLYNVTTIQSSSSSGFSEYIVPNNYYVTFQDEEDGERICFGDFLTIDNAKTFDIDLITLHSQIMEIQKFIQ